MLVVVSESDTSVHVGPVGELQAERGGVPCRHWMLARVAGLDEALLDGAEPLEVRHDVALLLLDGGHSELLEDDGALVEDQGQQVPDVLQPDAEPEHSVAAVIGVEGTGATSVVLSAHGILLFLSPDQHDAGGGSLGFHRNVTAVVHDGVGQGREGSWKEVHRQRPSSCDVCCDVGLRAIRPDCDDARQLGQADHRSKEISPVDGHQVPRHHLAHRVVERLNFSTLLHRVGIHRQVH